MSSSDQVALVRRGFEAMAEEAWEVAAREFATLRPLRPEDAAVITNLGLARLQDALSAGSGLIRGLRWHRRSIR